MTDTIADLLTRIRNASSAQHDSTVVKLSGLNKRVLDVFSELGFIESYEERASERSLCVYLKYTARDKKHPILHELTRVSCPGRRAYVSVQELEKLISHFSTSILSTNLGVMTAQKAKDKNIGGEHLCSVW